MKDTIKELLGSKRFFIVTLAVVALSVFVATGKIPLADFATKLTWLTGLLATLYGLENVADTATRPGTASPTDNSVNTTITMPEAKSPEAKSQ